MDPRAFNYAAVVRRGQIVAVRWMAFCLYSGAALWTVVFGVGLHYLLPADTLARQLAVMGCVIPLTLSCLCFITAAAVTRRTLQIVEQNQP